MQSGRWLRYGLGSLVLASCAMGGFLVACGDDDPVAAPDAGTTDSGTADTGTPAEDAGPADAGPTLPNAKLTVANAVLDLGAGANFVLPGPTQTNVTAIRVCFALNGNITPIPPQPDRSSGVLPPGIPIGFGGQFPSFGLDLEPLAVTPYIMNAQAMAAKGVLRQGNNPGPSCQDILGATGTGGDAGGGPLVENVDYWKLAEIPAGTFKKGESYALVLTGCSADADQANASGGRCGLDITFSDGGVGNLKVNIYTLDPGANLAATEFGAQVIHAASAVSGLGPVFPAITSPDGGVNRGTIGPDAGLTYKQISDLAAISGVDVATDSFVIRPGAPAAPLQIIRAVSFPNPDGGAAIPPEGAEYRNGAAFVFIALGDPTQPLNGGPGGTFNGRSAHMLAFPTDPTIQPYAP